MREEKNKLTEREGLLGKAGWGRQLETMSLAIMGGVEESLMDSAITRLMGQIAAARRSAQARVTERRQLCRNGGRAVGSSVVVSVPRG